jgi:S1-C subfamily serine protease
MGTWNDLSVEIAQAVEEVGSSVVTVQGRGGRTSSGIILDESTILTAAHTIRQEASLRAWTAPERPFAAKLAGLDSGTDIAVLKTEAKLKPAAPFADNPPLRIGQLVVAVARTWRGNLVASAGVLSGLMGEWHTFRGKKIEAFIRPDLMLYRGFSGGALIGADRNVIGMNTSGLRRGTPLAIPYATIKRITAVLREKGYIPTAYLGLGLQPVRISESLRRKLNLTHETGALVVHVESGGPAEQAGFLVGDTLLEIAEAAVAKERVTSILSRLAPGQVRTVAGIRGGQPFTSRIEIGERPHRGA